MKQGGAFEAALDLIGIGARGCCHESENEAHVAIRMQNTIHMARFFIRFAIMFLVLDTKASKIGTRREKDSLAGEVIRSKVMN